MNTILTAANTVAGINKATARSFRESDEYPLFYCAGGELPSGNNDAQDSGAKTYNQDWIYLNHIYVEAKDDDEDYSDYQQAEILTDEFLNELLPTSELELDDIKYYPAKIGGSNVIVSEITLKVFRTKRYGS